MKLSKTEQAIALLTLSLGKADSENLKPLSIREWNDLSSWLKANDFDPAQLLKNGQIISFPIFNQKMGMLIE